ncbi:SURF1 family protein [Isoptericola sp. b490]|uniref:SURF1 family cytochrome oxidase biogenesis protein n=1 Tax=Actinotalea lenta TaxID=3064654 RepID=UPI00271445F9|nr:SURF1 family protein [Isoptericola sp. b490]MDO8120833.1 SURF1 family protein [Isoptericola sp. b490]
MSERARRAIATFAVATLVSAACVLLGLWQWHRYVARSAAVAVVQANYDAAPVPIGQGVGGDATVSAPEEWHPVAATGHYLPHATVLLRNRPVNGTSGYHVLAPFLVQDGALAGTVVLVDRGFLPATGDAARVPSVPQPPTGQVDLVARLRVAEQPTERQAPAGQVQAIDVAAARATAAQPWSGPAVHGYAQAVTEDGAPPAGLGSLALPSTDLGPHLSYAFQWWVFASGALVGAVVLIRREGSASGPRRPPRRRHPTAEQEEDALLDAQEAAMRRATSTPRRDLP